MFVAILELKLHEHFHSVICNSWKWSHLGLQLTFNFPGLIVILAFQDEQNVLLLWEEDVFLNHFINYVLLKEGEAESQDLAWKQTQKMLWVFE